MSPAWMRANRRSGHFHGTTAPARDRPTPGPSSRPTPARLFHVAHHHDYSGVFCHRRNRRRARRKCAIPPLGPVSSSAGFRKQATAPRCAGFVRLCDEFPMHDARRMQVSGRQGKDYSPSFSPVSSICRPQPSSNRRSFLLITLNQQRRLP